MNRVLLTGGTGVLGSALKPLLAKEGYTVRVMSRSATPKWDNVEWAQAILSSGEGLDQALADVQTVVHLISDPVNTEEVDIGGTRHLLAAAQKAGVQNFIYISIVGIDRIPIGYYKTKLAVEKLIEESGVPYTIIRLPQFHTLIDFVLSKLAKYPVTFIPAGFLAQPMDTSDAARRVLEFIEAGASGHVPDVAGPEVLDAKTMMKTWLAARGQKRPILPIPFFGKIAAGYRHGYNTAPDSKYGQITWAQWVEKRYKRGA